MAEISQTISAFPSPPDSATDTPQQFNTKANAFVAHQANIYTGEVNTWATQANALRTDINSIVATIPSGQIDDATPSSTNTYSSQKQEATFAKKSDPSQCTAWGFFEDGAMITSYNIDSITKIATGVYDINFKAGALNNTNYAIFFNGSAIVINGAMMAYLPERDNANYIKTVDKIRIQTGVMAIPGAVAPSMAEIKDFGVLVYGGQ